MDPAARLAALLPACDRAEALDLYDSLPAVNPAAMLGQWKGEELATGHAYDGLLGPSGWWGKAFRSVDDVDPLVFERGGRRFAGNPGLMPLGLVERMPGLAKSAPSAALFRLLSPLLKTRKPRARLRPVTYRGVTSAAMIYDQLPIVDCFRRVDADTLLGAMDIRGFADPYFFVLRRA
ncbi:DUF4334 domain-containing protein [Sphingomonas rosea]|uniref:DUF4334 domain-containing protein n=1 Tax=Sphingomonas rosea TaxID=335605 RepID=A0ABP7UB51_9SPHN